LTDAARTITTVRVNMPEYRKIYTKTLFLTERHQVIKPLFEMAEPDESFGWRIGEVRKITNKEASVKADPTAIMSKILLKLFPPH
jgi:hypothetical protein